MCEYCEGDTEILGETDSGCCSIGVWIENNEIKGLHDYDTGQNVKINYCPICGRNLKEE